jgi:hypothetical protein
VDDRAGEDTRGAALAVWLALGLLFLVLLLGLALAYLAVSGISFREGVIGGLVRAYGLVTAGVASFTVVAVLKQTYGGPLSFRGLGFEFEGASGPVVMWLICYLGIVFSFRLLAG